MSRRSRNRAQRSEGEGRQTASLEAVLDRAALWRLAGARSFGRGEEYFAAGKVSTLQRRAGRWGAQVRGTQRYAVELWVQGGDLRFSCTCPIGEEGAFCKHCVAAGLAWLEQGGDPEEGGALDPGALRSFLSGLKKDRLVDLLVDQAERDDWFLQSLSVERAKGRGQRPNLSSLRRSLANAFDPGDFLSYREVGGFVEGLQRALDALESLLKEGHPEEVIALAEECLQLGEDALEQVDDSDGGVSWVMKHLQDLHLAACRKARPDPEALARRLFAMEMASDWETFYDAAETYAGVLGDQGLAVYRELAEKEWRKIPARQPGQRGDYDPKRFRVTGIMEALARATGDLEVLVSVKARDLSHPYQFLSIAQIYKEAGAADRALKWAEKGVRAFPKGTDPRLRSFLAEEYHSRGRHAEAMALLWANFVEAPFPESYEALKSRAEEVGSWSQWRERALGHLRDRAGEGKARGPGPPTRGAAGASGLVRILLWEGEVEAAWQEARELGCGEELWLDLAERREGSHPEESLPIYQRQVELALAQVNRSGYMEAVSRLQQIRGVMERLGRSRDFAGYLDAVRQSHKRKRNFMELLKKAGLG